jgi:hypothetical protein
MGIGKMFLVFQRSNKFMIVRGIPQKPNPSSGRDCYHAARRVLVPEEDCSDHSELFCSEPDELPGPTYLLSAILL